MEIILVAVTSIQIVEIVLLIVLKLCDVVLGHSEVGEKLQRVMLKLSIETLL